jgi:hypothetical protein
VATVRWWLPRCLAAGWFVRRGCSVRGHAPISPMGLPPLGLGDGRPEIAASFAAIIAHVSACGEWLTARQRLAIAHETRRIFAADDPEATHDRRDIGSVIPGPGCECLRPVLVKLVHQVCNDPAAIDQQFYDAVTGDPDVTPGDYVEAISIINHVIALDTWHLGMGLPPPLLPEPGTTAGEGQLPARVVANPKAKVHIAMVPTVAPEDADGSVVRQRTSSIARRAASLAAAPSLYSARARASWPVRMLRAGAPTSEGAGGEMVAAAAAVCCVCMYVPSWHAAGALGA